MIDRFTEKSIEAINRAREEARKLGKPYVETEQLLLGLMQADSGLAGKVLGDVHGHIKRGVERIIGQEAIPPPEIPFNPRAKKILERAWQEAKSRGCTEVGTEHILMAAMLEEGEAAMNSLKPLGLDPDSLKRKVIGLIGSATKPSSG